jgi:hypothetical protein
LALVVVFFVIILLLFFCLLGLCGMIRLMDRLVLWRIYQIVQQDHDMQLQEFKHKYLPQLNRYNITTARHIGGGEVIDWNGPFPPLPCTPPTTDVASTSSTTRSVAATLTRHGILLPASAVATRTPSPGKAARRNRHDRYDHRRHHHRASGGTASDYDDGSLAYSLDSDDFGDDSDDHSSARYSSCATRANSSMENSLSTTMLEELGAQRLSFASSCSAAGGDGGSGL